MTGKAFSRTSGLAGSAAHVLSVHVCFNQVTDVGEMISRFMLTQPLTSQPNTLIHAADIRCGKKQAELVIRSAEQTARLITDESANLSPHKTHPEQYLLRVRSIPEAFIVARTSVFRPFPHPRSSISAAWRFRITFSSAT